MLDAKGAEQANLEDTDLLTLADHVFHGLVAGIGTGAHDDNDLLGIRGTHVIEQLVLTTDDLGELVHGGLNDGRSGVIVFIDGFTSLEVDIRILGGTANRGEVRAQAAGLMGCDRRVVDHGFHVVIGQFFDLLNFVTGAETIEEVQERHAGFQGGGLSDQGHVHDFLDIGRGQHGKTGLAAGHDVRMVAEDRQGLAGQRTSRDVKDRRDHLTGDLVHVGDHQQQALRGRKGCCQGTSSEGPVDRTGCTGLGLHFCDEGTVPQMLGWPLAVKASDISPMGELGVIG